MKREQLPQKHFGDVKNPCGEIPLADPQPEVEGRPDPSDLEVISDVIMDQSKARLQRQRCCGCKTTCGLVYDKSEGRYVCGICLLNELNELKEKSR